MRGDFARGILAGVYLKSDLSEEEAKYLQTILQNEPFTHVSDVSIALKQVVNTNKCFLHVDRSKMMYC